MPRLKVVAAVLDGAKLRPSRPLTEFFMTPAWPIREMYLDRFLINLVWFARNYLNIILICAFIGAVYYPWFFLCLLSAIAVHVSKPASTARTAFKVGQVVACVFIYTQYGVTPPLVTAVIPMAFIALHGLFTPYSDEALTFYQALLKKCGEEGAEPRTPVETFLASAKTENQFAKAAADIPPLNLDTAYADGGENMSSEALSSTSLRHRHMQHSSPSKPTQPNGASSTTTTMGQKARRGGAGLHIETRHEGPSCRIVGDNMTLACSTPAVIHTTSTPAILADPTPTLPHRQHAATHTSLHRKPTRQVSSTADEHSISCSAPASTAVEPLDT